MFDEHITRRDALIRGGGYAGGLSLAAALAACGSTASSQSAASVPQGKPIRGGTLRFAQAGTPPGYDPQKWWNAQAQLVGTAVGEQLIGADPYNGVRLPKLAIAEPTVEGGGTVFTFKLRPNVTFHGGHGTVTAEDVKFSWERVMSPALAAEAGSLYTGISFVGLSAFLSGKAKHVAGLVPVDDLTFRVELTKPDSAFIPTFTYAHAVVLPASYYKGKSLQAVNWAPIGTGPFMLEHANPSSGARLVRNPDYWSPSEPHLNAVELTYNVDPALSILQIERGELDMMDAPIPAASVNAIRNNPALRDYYHQGPQDDCQWLALPTKVKPFGDVRVRKAVAMAIDKQKLARVVKGLGKAATGTFFSPLSPYFEDGVALPYNPAMAKQLLREAGYPQGFTAPFWWANQPPYSDMGPAIAYDLSAIGISTNVRSIIYDQYSNLTNPGPPAMIIFAWEDAYRHGSYVVDPAFTSAAIKAGCCNYSRWSSPQVDQLAQQGHSADPAVSASTYREIAKIVVRDEALWVPLLYPQRADLTNKTVKGFQVSLYPTGQEKPFAKYWLA